MIIAIFGQCSHFISPENKRKPLVPFLANVPLLNPRKQQKTSGPTPGQCFHFITPENNRKPLAFSGKYKMKN